MSLRRLYFFGAFTRSYAPGKTAVAAVIAASARAAPHKAAKNAANMLKNELFLNSPMKKMTIFV